MINRIWLIISLIVFTLFDNNSYAFTSPNKISFQDSIELQKMITEGLTIDFNKLEGEYKTTVPYKGSKAIIINNLNRKLFDIEDAKVERDYNTDMPSSLTGIKLPSFLSLGGLPKLSRGAAAKPSPFDKKKRLDSEENHPEIAIPYYLDEIKRRAEKLDYSAFLYNEISALTITCLKSSDIFDRANNLVDLYLHDSASSCALSSGDLFSELRDSLLDMRRGAEALLQHLDVKIPEYIQLIQKQLEDEKTAYDEAVLAEEAKLKNPLLTRVQKQRAEESLSTNKNLSHKVSNKMKEFSGISKELQDDLKEAEDAIKQMYNYEKEDKPRILLKLFSLVSSGNLFRYTVILQKAKKDVTTFTFTVKPKELTTCSVIDKRVIEVKVETMGGIKVDFSTGVFVNVGDDDFLGRTYYYKNLIGDTTREILSAERPNRLMLSIGALAHIYARSSSKLKLAGSLGVSTTADFETLNFHAGPSLIFGKEDRLILTGGLTMKTSALLDRQLEMSQPYHIKESPDEIPTVNVFPKTGLFIALTYNISRFGKE
jgi:hypothetical protein